MLAGLGIPILAALNSGVGAKLQSPLLATVLFFTVCLTLMSAILLLMEGVPNWQKLSFSSIPFYYYFAGVLFIFYLLSVTLVGPRFGFGNAIAFVLIGQLISMVIIDHFALVGAPHYPFSLQRLMGLLCMVVGIILVVKKL